MDDLISVVMPVYNRKEAFLQSVASVGSQTYRNIELIVVDDGSTEFDIRDMELHIPSHIQTAIIRQDNGGAQNARNRGLREAKGMFVIFWDADLIARPEMVERLYTTLKSNSDASYAYCNFYWGAKKFEAGVFDAERLKEMNYITMTSLMRRDVLEPLDETVRKFQDWDLWLTLLAKGKTGVWVDEYLMKILTGGTMSSWLPSFAYKKPWKWIPGIRGKVIKYEDARRAIQQKHQI